MSGYGQAFEARKGGETCFDCGKRIHRGQTARYRYGEGNRSRALCHADCSQAEAVPSSYGQTFSACRDKGTCADCGQMIREGQLARYRYTGDSRVMVHLDCEAVAAQVAQQEQARAAARAAEDAETPYRIGGGEGYGYSEYREGTVVHNPRQEGPRYLYVVSASSRYYREDGMSFGVGDESGYVYTARCREATDEESADLRRADEARAAHKQAEHDLDTLKREVMSTGECPRDAQPEGEVFGRKGGTIYGGGDWWVVSDEHIWYVRNNGADGDDWSRNNVLTSGAGAIGWRVSRTEHLYSRLVAARKALTH